MDVLWNDPFLAGIVLCFRMGITIKHGRGGLKRKLFRNVGFCSQMAGFFTCKFGMFVVKF